MFQQFGLKHYWLSRFCSFPEAEENPRQVTPHLAKPASETTKGNHAECSDQATFPMTCDNSWKIKVLYIKKSMSRSFASSFHEPNNFPWKQTCSVSSSTPKVLPVAPFRLGQADLPGPRGAGFRRSHS